MKHNKSKTKPKFIVLKSDGDKTRVVGIYMTKAIAEKYAGTGCRVCDKGHTFTIAKIA